MRIKIKTRCQMLQSIRCQICKVCINSTKFSYFTTSLLNLSLNICIKISNSQLKLNCVIFILYLHVYFNVRLAENITRSVFSKLSIRALIISFMLSLYLPWRESSSSYLNLNHLNGVSSRKHFQQNTKKLLIPIYFIALFYINR